MSKKILVVEDEATLLKELSEKIQEAGFEVIEAKNGDEAIHTVLTAEPDCVLLDISLPTINGIEVIRLIRQSGECGARLPVIFLTNLNMTDQMTPALSQDAPAFYLVKAETSLDEIVEKIKSCCDPSRPSGHTF